MKIKKERIFTFTPSCFAIAVFFGPLNPQPPVDNGLTENWNWYANENSMV